LSLDPAKGVAVTAATNALPKAPTEHKNLPRKDDIIIIK
jgi:hypothetical protein